jgi:hypothetical protein
MDAAKVRPQPLRHKDLGIGDLPQQKIRNPHFARGANQQIRIRHVRRIEMPVYILFTDAIR